MVWDHSMCQLSMLLDGQIRSCVAGLLNAKLSFSTPYIRITTCPPETYQHDCQKRTSGYAKQF